MRIFVTGGTGLIGGWLVERLLARGDSPILLTRRPEIARARWGQRCGVVAGDPAKVGAWTNALGECDAVVHLAGEGIFNRRWSAAFKELLRSSRIEATANIARLLAENPRCPDGTPRTLVSGSAVGVYGPRGDEELDENAAVGGDFLANLCIDWERAAQPAIAAGVRVAWLRTGIVLDGNGGALKPMLFPFKMFAGGPVGSGRQVMSWIHIQDEIGLVLHILDNPQAAGPINATAPHPVTNREFARTLGRVLRRPSFMPMPRFMLRVLVGEAADVIATGQRVLPRQAQKLGYTFTYPELEPALRQLLGRP